MSNVDEVIFLTKSDHAMIVYTLVRPEIRQYIKEAAEKAEIVAYDIIGPLIDNIQSISGETPLMSQG